MPKARPTYTPEFRADAVDLLRTSGKPLSQVARELGVSGNSLRGWRKDLFGGSAAQGRGAVGDKPLGGASAEEVFAENQRLRQEVTYLKRQREILKKAATILAEDPQLGMR